MSEAQVLIPPGMSKAEFYRRDMLPLIEKSKQQNLESADQAVARLHVEFARFKAGIPDFVDDVASLGSRWHMLQGMTADKWVNYWRASDDSKSEQVKQFMLAKFRTHIMSEEAMQKAVRSAMAQFKRRRYGQSQSAAARSESGPVDPRRAFRIPEAHSPISEEIRRLGEPHRANPGNKFADQWRGRARGQHGRGHRGRTIGGLRD